jgi:hypothetical protein
LAEKEAETAGMDGNRAFERKVVDVRKVFGEAMADQLVDGRIADKEKLEQVKLKISARLVNFVVGGGVLLFVADNHDTEPSHEQLEEGHELSMTGMFQLLRETIFRMLSELNKPDVNLLKVSMAKEFRNSLQKIFNSGAENGLGKFPVKIFQDFHKDRGYYIAINMRNTRSVGDDIDRIERDEELRREIVEAARSCRHSDGNLIKLFGPDLSAGTGGVSG